jgi:hypothetical protein
MHLLLSPSKLVLSLEHVILSQPFRRLHSKMLAHQNPTCNSSLSQATVNSVMWCYNVSCTNHKSSSQYSVLNCPLTSSLVCPNIFQFIAFEMPVHNVLPSHCLQCFAMKGFSFTETHTNKQPAAHKLSCTEFQQYRPLHQWSLLSTPDLFLCNQYSFAFKLNYSLYSDIHCDWNRSNLKMN